MHKTALTILAALMSGNAAAGWTAVGRSESSTLYADFATIKKTDDKATMLDLLDFKSMQESDGHRYLSSKTMSEYDCAQGQARIIYFSWHAGRMGAGEVVNTDIDPSKWETVPPNSGVEKLFKLACGKR